MVLTYILSYVHRTAHFAQISTRQKAHHVIFEGEKHFILLWANSRIDGGLQRGSNAGDLSHICKPL